MSLPLPVAQPPESSSPDHASCGLLATRSVVQVSIPGWMGSIPDNATASQIAAAIPPILHPTVVYGDPPVASDRYVIVGVNCTSQAVPVPYVTGIRHWVAAYAYDLEYNCWHSTYDPCDLVACHSSVMGSVLVDAPAPKPQEFETMGAYLRFTINGSTDHLAWVGKDGTLHFDSRVDATGQWVSDVISTGSCQSQSPVTAEVVAGQMNVWAYGANGDRYHWAYDGTKWVGIPG